MAKTIVATVEKRISIGGTLYAYFGTLTPDTSYAVTTGDTITNPSEGLKLPEKILHMSLSCAGGYLAEFVTSTGKIKIYVSAAGAKEPAQEVADAKDVSAAVFRYIAYGS